MVQTSLDPNAGAIPPRRCSMFSVYLVGGYFALVYGLSLAAFPATLDFIQRTGGKRCWADSSPALSMSIDIGQLMFGVIATFLLWRWNREGRCHRSLVFFIVVVAEALTEMILRQGCSQ